MVSGKLNNVGGPTAIIRHQNEKYIHWVAQVVWFGTLSPSTVPNNMTLQSLELHIFIASCKTLIPAALSSQLAASKASRYLGSLFLCLLSLLQSRIRGRISISSVRVGVRFPNSHLEKRFMAENVLFQRGMGLQEMLICITRYMNGPLWISP